MKKYFFLFTFLLFATLKGNTHREYTWISIGEGIFKPAHPEVVWQIEAKSRLFFSHIRSQIGALTGGGQSMYFYGGVGWEVALFRNFYFYPNFSPGIYFQGSSPTRMGCPVEFRSCLEGFFELNARVRVGGQFFHVSNARLGRHNPGANGAVMYLAFAFE